MENEDVVQGGGFVRIVIAYEVVGGVVAVFFLRGAGAGGGGNPLFLFFLISAPYGFFVQVLPVPEKLR